jgi:hypothetical protein
MIRRFRSRCFEARNRGKINKHYFESENNFEPENDILCYDDYTEDTVPSVRGEQYNPMIVGEREALYKSVIRSIHHKEAYAKYADLFYIEGKHVYVGGGVEPDYSTDDFTSVNLVCDLNDGETEDWDDTIESFSKDLVIDYYDFMDSYDIEADIEDYILEELHKYMESILRENDNKSRKRHEEVKDESRRRAILFR